jgi:hypothetical protein
LKEHLERLTRELMGVKKIGIIIKPEGDCLSGRIPKKCQLFDMLPKNCYQVGDHRQGKGG